LICFDRSDGAPNQCARRGNVTQLSKQRRQRRPILLFAIAPYGPYTCALCSSVCSSTAMARLVRGSGLELLQPRPARS
jgi:hypothetical protein